MKCCPDNDDTTLFDKVIKWMFFVPLALCISVTLWIILYHLITIGVD